MWRAAPAPSARRCARTHAGDLGGKLKRLQGRTREAACAAQAKGTRAVSKGTQAARSTAAEAATAAQQAATAAQQRVAGEPAPSGLFGSTLGGGSSSK